MARVVPPGQMVQNTTSPTGAVLGKVAELGFGLAGQIAESEAAEAAAKAESAKAQLERLAVERKANETSQLFSRAEEIFRTSIENKPRGMPSEDFNMNVKLQMFKELGSGRYGSLSYKEMQGAMGMFDGLLDDYHKTERVMEDGSIITYDTASGEIRMNTDQAVQAEVLANKARTKFATSFPALVGSIHSSYAPEVAQEKIGNMMGEIASIERRSQNLALYKAQLEIQGKEQALIGPAIRAKLMRDVVIPNVSSVREIGRDLAPGFKGTQEELELMMKNMVREQVLNSPNVMESIAASGTDIDQLMVQIDKLGEDVGKEVGQLHKDAGLSAEAARLGWDATVRQHNVMAGLTQEQFAASVLGKAFPIDGALGLQMWESRFGSKFSTSDVEKVRADSTTADRILDQLLSNTDDDAVVSSGVQRAYTSLLALRDGGHSELGVSALRYWHTLRGNKEIMSKLPQDVIDKIDDLYRAASGDRADIVNDMLGALPKVPGKQPGTAPQDSEME